LCNGFRTTRPESTTSGCTEGQPTQICPDFSGSAAIDFDSRLPLNLRVLGSIPRRLTTFLRFGLSSGLSSFCLAQDFVEPIGGPLLELQVWQKMGVGVERELDRRMAEQLLNHFRVFPRR
jgi:hypothetical protein